MTSCSGGNILKEIQPGDMLNFGPGQFPEKITVHVAPFWANSAKVQEPEVPLQPGDDHCLIWLGLMYAYVGCWTQIDVEDYFQFGASLVVPLNPGVDLKVFVSLSKLSESLERLASYGMVELSGKKVRITSMGIDCIKDCYDERHFMPYAGKRTRRTFVCYVSGVSCKPLSHHRKDLN